MDQDPDGSRFSSPPELAALRYDRLRLTAPAVQHEINNALMVLASNLELLGRSAGEGAPRRQLDRAGEAMQRLDRTIRGFLDAARRAPEEVAEVEPASAVVAALPLLRLALGGRFGLEVEPGAGVPAVRLDRARFDLGLLWLMRDLATRLPPGGQVAIRAALREAGEVALLLDLPPGIEPEADCLALLAAAAAPGQGRLERSGSGLVLVWPLL